MQHSFRSEFFSKNRRQATIIAGQPIVLTANGLLQRNADNSYPFSQDRNFWYLTGIDLPDITLVIDGDEEYLIVPGRNASREAFDGAIDPAELTEISGIKTVLKESAGWARLLKRLRQTRRYATPLPAPGYIAQYGIYTNPAREALAARIEAGVPNVTAHDIRPQLARLRCVKQPAELQAIQTAIDITSQSLATVAKRLASYQNEYEIEADLGREFRFRGAAGHAFAPIVAGAKRACTLHNVSNSAPLIKNSLVVIDIGAEVDNYAADITRTLCYGQPSQRQQAVYDAVLDVQSYALSLLKPGILLKEYEQKVETYMGGKLQELGLIVEASHDAIRKYFPHSASHFLGLDVHDAGDYSQPLEENMVVTCEPGIYIPEEGIGVRIEDDVLITAVGNTVLSAALPRQLVL